MLEGINDRELLIITDVDYCHHRVKDVFIGQDEFRTMPDRKTIVSAGGVFSNLTMSQAFKVFVRSGCPNDAPRCVAIYNNLASAKAAMQLIVNALENAGGRVQLPDDGKMAYYELPLAYTSVTPLT